MPRLLSIQFGIRTLLAITFAVALFLSGYRIGHNHGERGRKDELNRLIQLVAGLVDTTWVTDGGEDTLQNNFSIECHSHDYTDVGSAEGIDVFNNDMPESNPFREVREDDTDLNPFE